MPDDARPASSDLTPVELLICTKCRASNAAPDADDEIRPGTKLMESLTQSDVPPHVTVRGVECLSNCTRGCTIALRGPGRWSYVYGNLDASSAQTVLDGASRYQSAADGLVPWRERSDHFRKNCIARIPPLEA